jgi:hypothetical protein
MIDTYLLGAASWDQTASSTPWLQAGVRLELQRSGNPTVSSSARSRAPSRLEVRTQDGSMLGYLPPEDADEITEYMEAGASAMVFVRGVVPAFRRPRVQLVVELVAA